MDVRKLLADLIDSQAMIENRGHNAEQRKSI